MTSRYSLVLDRQRHLKWRWLDPVEQALMVLCGVALGWSAATLTQQSEPTVRTVIVEVQVPGKEPAPAPPSRSHNLPQGASRRRTIPLRAGASAARNRARSRNASPSDSNNSPSAPVSSPPSSTVS